jgi:pimeloyl-ACP methyl ester carboxylesterase
MLGFGETEKAGVRSEMDLAWHLRSFLDALELSRVTLIGNSKGAYWATRMMIDDPERVERCVIVGSNTVAQAMGLPRIETEGTRALDRYDGSREAITAFLSAILETPPSEADIDERVRLVNLPGAQEAYAALGAFGRRRREPHLWQAYALEGRLPIVIRAVPTLLLWGRKDRFAPVEQALALRELLPEAELEILEASGHQAQNDEPDRFVEVVRAFLADQRGA